MNHFINTAAVEPSKARTPSLLSTTQQPFPVLFFGDTRAHSFFFHSDGTIESWSGDDTYTLRVTLGDPSAGPFGGTFTLACGSTSAPLAYNATAELIQSALNGLTTIQSQGAVTVTGEFPTFMIYADAVGVRTNFTASAALLSPNGAITVEILTTGSGSVRQEWRMSIRRNVISSSSTWTTITSPSNGWTGNLTTNTESALALLVNEGETVGGFLQADTVVTVEVVDPDGNPVSFFQMPFLLRAKPTDIGATSATPMAAFQPLNATLSLISATNDLSGVTVDGTNVVGFRNVPSNSKSANYTTVLADSGKSIDHPASDANTRTFTIDASLSYQDGTCISFSNMAAQAVTISLSSGTMYLAGDGTTGSRTLAQFGFCTVRLLPTGDWLACGINLT